MKKYHFFSLKVKMESKEVNIIKKYLYFLEKLIENCETPELDAFFTNTKIDKV